MLPPFLKPGDTIGIAATARWITAEQLQPALDLFQSWGLRVRVAQNVHTQHFQLAGDDAARTRGLQQMLDDPDIRAVIIARGGYGTVRVIDRLDFSGFLENPKWICGYSDITVLHSWLSNHGVASIHSTMPISFPSATPAALEDLRHCLFGTYPVSDKTGVRTGVQGRISGGNLSVLYSQLGSATQLNTQDTILFVEDVDEMHYHVDRMMMALLRSGSLDNVRGIAAGGLTQMKDNTMKFGFTSDNSWGCEPLETIHSIASQLGVPVLHHLAAGHQDDNRAFYLGVEALLREENGIVRIGFEM